MKEKRIELSLDEMTSISEFYEAQVNPEQNRASEKVYEKPSFTQEDDDLDLPPKPELIPLPEEPPKKKFSLFGRKKAQKESDTESAPVMEEAEIDDTPVKIEEAEVIEEVKTPELAINQQNHIEPKPQAVTKPEVKKDAFVIEEKAKPEIIKASAKDSSKPLVKEVLTEPVTMPAINIIDDTTAILSFDEEEKQSEYYLIDLETNEIHSITKDAILVGCKSDVCDIVIKEEGEKHTISRTHAYFYVKNDKIYAKDVSSNGTFIELGASNNAPSFYRLPKGFEVEVKPDQIIKFAERKFQLKKQ